MSERFGLDDLPVLRLALGSLELDAKRRGALGSVEVLKDIRNALDAAEEKIALLTRTIETLVKEQEKTGQI